MSVNFCVPALQPKLSTSTVCADGHGVENLIKFNPFRGGWKGFMAEGFIKPPVDITIEFPIKICLEKIVLDPCVGRQKSSGFEIYSASVTQPAQQGSSNEKPKDDNTTPIFTKIANALIPWTSMSQDSCTLRFSNSRYRASFPDIIRLSPQKQDSRGPEDVDRFLRLATPGAVENVNCITIRITRTHAGSLVVLRRLEVWGEPSVRIPKEPQMWALKIIQNMFSNKDDVLHKGNVSGSKKESSHTCVQNGNSDAVQPLSHNGRIVETSECPEDFLDPITFQMMMLPILLPSGHTVDRSTLEKHNKIEAVWGRPANDPFTGVAFTSKSQPVPNVKLKTRLDQYLLKAGDKHKLLARDVGRASDASSSCPSASSLVMPSATPNKSAKQMQTSEQTKMKKPNLIYETRHRNLPVLNVNTSKLSNQTKKTHSPSDQKRGINASADYSTNQQPLVKKAKLYHQPVARRAQYPVAGHSKWNLHPLSMPPEGLQSTITETKSHEESLTDSLDSALNQALGSLPSYSSTSDNSLFKASNDLRLVTSSSNPPPSCTVCHAEVNTALNGKSLPATSLYRLPCTHLICRTCLTTTTVDQSSTSNQHDTRFCACCGRTYRKEDVVRVHV